ncbi:type IV secretion system DNA-binding domain-containing protein [Vibrio sp. OPT10]|uniref:type IV secretion system DNA-binding domain-containing protein n=1 Tax=Vibrio sp. OPT10 TaxID=2778640 RepID=UPI00188291AC|nr:type IV secretion system DNA-binding domain-containing protein [Vibrio sp. OPT10]MBE8606867.1 type IV secretion system DNA-binding domain-containing protein [Vibrio sp. OPT10]
MHSVTRTITALIAFVSSIILSIPVACISISTYWAVSTNQSFVTLVSLSLDWLSNLNSYAAPIASLDLWQSIFQLENTEVIIQYVLTPFVLSFSVSLLFVLFCLKSREAAKQLTHVSGPKFYLGKKAIKHARTMNKKDLRLSSITSPGVNVHPKIKITLAREQNNFLILGTTGSGKSTVFKPLVKQAIERGDNAVIYDEKGEYTESFYRKETSVLIAPWDERGAKWNISHDIKSKQDAELFAQCLIPNSANVDPLWDQGARIILVSMLMKLINKQSRTWGWSDLYKQLTFTPEVARSIFVEHHPLANSLLEPNSKTTQSFYVHIMSKLSWIEDLANAWPKDLKAEFSLSQWVKTDTTKHIVIIQADSQYQSLGEPLCNAIISFMTKHYLSESYSSKRRTWLFIDEFANLPRNPSISKWLELARANGARTVLCTQSISQLHDIYGKDETSTILNLLSNVIAFRMGAAGQDAEETANIFGQYEAEIPNYEHRRRIGTRVERPLVRKSDLIHLSQPTQKGVEGYMQIPGWRSVYKLRWPLFKDIKSAPKKISAKWLTSSNSKPLTTHQTNRLNKRNSSHDVN